MTAFPSRRRLIMVGTVAMALAASLVLTSCSPVRRTVVRLNDDGTLDFASCVAVNDVTEVDGTASQRSGILNQIDSATEVDLTLAAPIDELDVGQVITFSGLPEEWDRLDVYIRSGDSSSYVWAAIERGELSPGEWFWGDGRPFTDYVPEERCALEEAAAND